MIARSCVPYSLLVGYSAGSLLGLQAWNLVRVDEWLGRGLGGRAWGHKVSDESLIGEAKGKAKPGPREPNKCEPRD